MRTRKISTAILLVMFMFAGCAYNIGLVKTTYKLLSASQISYDTAMTMAADLYIQGRITTEQKIKAIEIGTTYSTAHNAAVEALASYAETRSMEDQEKMTAQIEIATTALSKLLALIRPYLEVN